MLKSFYSNSYLIVHVIGLNHEVDQHIIYEKSKVNTHIKTVAGFRTIIRG